MLPGPGNGLSEQDPRTQISLLEAVRISAAQVIVGGVRFDSLHGTSIDSALSEPGKWVSDTYLGPRTDILRARCGWLGQPGNPPSANEVARTQGPGGTFSGEFLGPVTCRHKLFVVTFCR